MMNESLVRKRLVVLAVLLCLVVLLWLPLLPFAQGVARSSSGEAELTVAFLDVGQGDGIFIETPDGVQVLIDGGPDAAVLRALGQVMAVGDRTIDVVLGTHPDKDHVAGLVDVLSRYQASTIIRTENTNDTTPSRAFDAAVLAEEAAVVYARSGQVWQLGASTTLTVLSPSTNPKEWESNASSIVALVRYGETEFLLTGDAGEGTELFLVEYYGEALESDVLKLGHHGSRTSSSKNFLEAVRPHYAVVSAGKDNDYGHPHDEVVTAVQEAGATVVNTAERGTLVFKSDGRSVRLLD